MKWDVQTVGFNADDSLVDYAREKTSKLGKFYDRIVGAEIYLKLVEGDQDNKKAEIKLNIPGNDLYAESTQQKFEGAINEAHDKLKAQITTLKGKTKAF